MRIAEVAAEGRLPVRPRRDEPEEVEPPAGGHGGEKAPDGGGSVVFERLGGIVSQASSVSRATTPSTAEVAETLGVTEASQSMIEQTVLPSTNCWRTSKLVTARPASRAMPRYPSALSKLATGPLNWKSSASGTPLRSPLFVFQAS